MSSAGKIAMLEHLDYLEKEINPVRMEILKQQLTLV